MSFKNWIAKTAPRKEPHTGVPKQYTTLLKNGFYLGERVYFESSGPGNRRMYGTVVNNPTSNPYPHNIYTQWTGAWADPYRSIWCRWDDSGEMGWCSPHQVQRVN